MNEDQQDKAIELLERMLYRMTLINGFEDDHNCVHDHVGECENHRLMRETRTWLDQHSFVRAAKDH